MFFFSFKVDKLFLLIDSNKDLLFLESDLILWTDKIIFILSISSIPIIVYISTLYLFFFTD